MNQIDIVLANVSLVTVNSKLREFIENSINYNKGKLRGCPSSSNECNFLFKNSRGERVYINIISSSVYVYVNRIDGIEEISYCRNSDGVSVSYKGCASSCIFGNLQTIKTTEEHTRYDVDGKLLVHKSDINESTYINGEVFKDLLYTNYNRSICDFISDDELVRFDNYRYDFHSELDRNLCYVSEYNDGMFASMNDTDIIKPRYIPYNGDISSYSDKLEFINKKSAQNVKSMI